jgi:hypothetical protein
MVAAMAVLRITMFWPAFVPLVLAAGVTPAFIFYSGGVQLADP